MTWFTRLRSWVSDDNAGIGIRSDYHDSEDDNFATGINSCLNIGGQNSPTANIPFGNFKITALGSGSAATDSVNLGQVQSRIVSYAATSGTDTYTATLSPAITAYVTGQTFFINVGITNTTASTINFNSVGAKDIRKFGSLALVSGDLVAGTIYGIEYDGTVFQLLSPISNLRTMYVKGADVASATTTNLATTTGDFVNVTGTTTITGLGTANEGVLRGVRFTGALTLTHNATSLILPNNGSNITTANGDNAVFRSLGSGNWVCINYTKVNGTSLVTGKAVQLVNTQTGAVATGTTVVPFDDTIPQNTEGDQYMTLAVTPISSSNLLIIDVFVNATSSVAGNMIVGLFQDTTANSLSASVQAVDSAGRGSDIPLRYYMVAGTTSATTFKVRVGNNQAGTTTFNGSAGSRLFGGIYNSSITITEVAA